MNQKESLSISALKAKADVLDSFLKGKAITLPRTQLLEAVAKMSGYANWSTARAAAGQRKANPTPKLQPIDTRDSFDIDVLRVGYGCTTLEVRASSAAEALDRALAEAENADFSEYHADYYVAGQEGETLTNYKLSDSEKLAGPEAVYEVEVCQASYGYHTIAVRADSKDKAGELALDKAGDYYFCASEHRLAVNSILKRAS